MGYCDDFELLLEQLRRRLAEKKQLDAPKRRRSPRRRLNSLELLETPNCWRQTSISKAHRLPKRRGHVSGSELVVTGIGAEQRYALARTSNRCASMPAARTIRFASTQASPLSATAAIELIAEEIYVAAGVSITVAISRWTSQGAEDALTVGSNLPIDIADIFSGDRVIEIGKRSIADWRRHHASKPRGFRRWSVRCVPSVAAKRTSTFVSARHVARQRHLDHGQAPKIAISTIWSKVTHPTGERRIAIRIWQGRLPVPVAVMIRRKCRDIDLKFHRDQRDGNGIHRSRSECRFDYERHGPRVQWSSR